MFPNLPSTPVSVLTSGLLRIISLGMVMTYSAPKDRKGHIDIREGQDLAWNRRD
jgi:hypothetical protein